MIFAFAFECFNIGKFDFVNVMNCYSAIYNHILSFFCHSHLNMLVNGKRIYILKTLHEKSQAVKDLEKEISNKGI